jgi:GT2 family glycosyltransferase
MNALRARAAVTDGRRPPRSPGTPAPAAGAAVRAPDPALPAPPAVSVIVPHLNQADALRRCLAALTAQRLPAGRFEVIVVDNGSAAPPVAVVADFPGVRLVAEPAPGPGPARNRGASLARGAILAFTDADCIAEPDWLDGLLAGFAAEPGTGVLAGPVRVYPEVPGQPSPAEAFELLYAFRQQWQIARHGFAATANLAVRREVFAAVGPFGDIAIAEDLDWGQRARAAGFPTRFLPRAAVWHPARRSWFELTRKWDRQVSHYWGLQPPGLAGRLAWGLQACAIALSPLAEVGRIVGTRRLMGPRERLMAFGVLARLRLYRARRMLAALVDEGVRTRSRRWNRR